MSALQKKPLGLCSLLHLSVKHSFQGMYHFVDLTKMIFGLTISPVAEGSPCAKKVREVSLHIRDHEA